MDFETTAIIGAETISFDATRKEGHLYQLTQCVYCRMQAGTLQQLYMVDKDFSFQKMRSLMPLRLFREKFLQEQNQLPKTEKSVPGKIPPTPNSETVTASKSKEAVNDTSAKHTAASKQIILTAAINQKTYLPRLGLARILRITGEIDESRKYYNEVISMSPEVHDAYIEMAEMLAKNDPLAAVDVYAKFPVSETPTFDDAYIFCEIIRLLINNEQYDDPRLGPMMIAYGKVLGMGSLEKYVEILDSKFKIDTLKFVYAEVNNKAVDDPDLQAFFKFKCWI